MKDINYIKATQFKDFCTNQNTLIEVLNHRMTQLEGHLAEMKVDVNWTKKLLCGILSILVIASVTIIIKSAFGI